MSEPTGKQISEFHSELNKLIPEKPSVDSPTNPDSTSYLGIRIAEVIFFNNKGKIIKKKTIGSYGKGLDFFYRLDSSIYHTFNIKSKYFIFHESTEGPLIKSKTSYATWSPPEDNLIEAKNFIRSL